MMKIPGIINKTRVQFHTFAVSCQKRKETWWESLNIKLMSNNNHPATQKESTVFSCWCRDRESFNFWAHSLVRSLCFSSPYWNFQQIMNHLFVQLTIIQSKTIDTCIKMKLFFYFYFFSVKVSTHTKSKNGNVPYHFVKFISLSTLSFIKLQNRIQCSKNWSCVKQNVTIFINL